MPFQKTTSRGWAFGVDVKTLFGMPASHVQIPEPQLSLQFQLPANVLLGRQSMVSQVVGPLKPMGEIWIGFFTPCFDRHLGGSQLEDNISLCLSNKTVKI